MVYRQMRGRKIDVNFAIVRGRVRVGSWLRMSWGLLGPPAPRPSRPPSPGWMDGSTGSSGTGSITPGVGTVPLLHVTGGGEGSGFPSSHHLQHGPEQAAAPVPCRRDARPLGGEDHVGRVINSSRYSLALQTWFGCAASGGLLSLASGEISTAFTTIKVASKHYGPAQYKITVNTLK